MKKVGIIMGSKSDLPIMQDAIDILNEFDIESEVNIVSAHRTPNKMFNYASKAKEKGINVIIAGAGGAAHLPGMVASITTLPVIGVPVKSRNSIDGWDSVLSILQMPNGVPVATVALDGAKNAGILAAQIIGLNDNNVAKKLIDYRNVFNLTIDPVDARDFDDALSLQKLTSGEWEVGVHIADVSHYVPCGSELDREAKKRGNSTYLLSLIHI